MCKGMCEGNTNCPICRPNMGKSVQERQILIELAADKPFVQLVATISVFRNNSKLFPSKKKKLLPLRYELKLITYAMNELLGRPVPSVLNQNHLVAMLAEAKVGNFARLDKILGFASTDGKEKEIHDMEHHVKMNNIMHKILKAKGLDYAAIIAESARIMVAVLIPLGETRRENNRKEKQRKITKMKLNNQRKLGVVKTCPSRPDSVDNQDKRCQDAGKIKTAKDHEHYRKSQRPTRI